MKDQNPILDGSLPKPLFMAVVTEAAKIWDVEPVGLLARSRRTRFALPRFAVAAILWNQFGLSMSDASRCFGREVSWARHAIAQVEAMNETDPQWREKFKALLFKAARVRRNYGN